MAKQLGALRFSGKFANTVGFKNSLSRVAGQQFVREHVDTVYNPKTYAQAKQRAKTRPAQIFYDAFENVLNHAFLPRERASKNRNAFLSAAMKLDYVPDVAKGEIKIPYAPYQISRGTLALDALTLGDYSVANPDIVTFPIESASDQLGDDMTVAQFTTALFDSPQGLNEGEELTFLAVIASKDDPSLRQVATMSVVLNLSDTVTTLADLWGRSILLTAVEVGNQVNLAIQPQSPSFAVLAAGLIISSKTSTSWKYTNSFMALSAYALDALDYEERDIVASYMNGSTSNDSDKILQQADNAVEAGTVTFVRAENMPMTLVGIEGEPLSANAAVAVMSDGSRRVIVGRGNSIYYVGSGNVLLLNTVNSLAIKLEQTSLAGNPTLSVSDAVSGGIGGPAPITSTDAGDGDGASGGSGGTGQG